MDYELITVINDIKKFTKMVNDKLEQGYELHGPTSVACEGSGNRTRYCQAVVKDYYENEGNGYDDYEDEQNYNR